MCQSDALLVFCVNKFSLCVVCYSYSSPQHHMGVPQQGRKLLGCNLSPSFCDPRVVCVYVCLHLLLNPADRRFCRRWFLFHAVPKAMCPASSGSCMVCGSVITDMPTLEPRPHELQSMLPPPMRDTSPLKAVPGALSPGLPHLQRGHQPRLPGRLWEAVSSTLSQAWVSPGA